MDNALFFVEVNLQTTDAIFLASINNTIIIHQLNQYTNIKNHHNLPIVCQSPRTWNPSYLCGLQWLKDILFFTFPFSFNSLPNKKLSTHEWDMIKIYLRFSIYGMCVLKSDESLFFRVRVRSKNCWYDSHLPYFS